MTELCCYHIIGSCIYAFLLTLSVSATLFAEFFARYFFFEFHAELHALFFGHEICSLSDMKGLELFFVSTS